MIIILQKIKRHYFLRRPRHIYTYFFWHAYQYREVGILTLYPAALGFCRTRSSKTQSNNVLYCKGAPENILSRCDTVMLEGSEVVKLTAARKQEILDKVNNMASRPLRTLALALKTDMGSLATYDGEHHAGHKQLTNPDNYEGIESGMTFVGLVGIKDPFRPEVPGAIDRCAQAGIRVIVITGDKKETAEAICRDIHVFGKDEDLHDRSFTGQFVKS